MKVKIIGWTTFNHQAVADEISFDSLDNNSASNLIEYAGRSCYESFGKPNPATATNDGYLKHIIESKHFSVLEHGSLTYDLQGISRSCTHELVRHRHLSFSQSSQRYVDQSSKDFVIPPVLNAYLDYKVKGYQHVTVGELLLSVGVNGQEAYDLLVETLKDEIPRKALRGAARAVLPEATETRIVVTGNHSALRQFFYKRLATDPKMGTPLADLEIYELAYEMLKLAKEYEPNLYQDFGV